MIEKLIRKHATAKLKGNTLSIRGTNEKELGDILTDALLLIPKKTEWGKVSLSVYLQAEEIYKRYRDDLLKLDHIVLSGHSLGGGICCIIPYFLVKDGYDPHDISLVVCGGLKVMSKRFAWNQCNHIWIPPIVWRVNHRDPVPHLPFWREPEHSTPREGEKRKHWFDWSMKAHLSYWG